MYNKTYHKFIERNDFSGNKKKFLECGEYNYKSSFIGLKKKGIMKLPMDMHSNGLLILGSYKSYRRRFANHYAKELIKKGTKVLYITDALSEEQYRPKFEIESFTKHMGLNEIDSNLVHMEDLSGKFNEEVFDNGALLSIVHSKTICKDRNPDIQKDYNEKLLSILNELSKSDFLEGNKLEFNKPKLVVIIDESASDKFLDKNLFEEKISDLKYKNFDIVICGYHGKRYRKLSNYINHYVLFTSRDPEDDLMGREFFRRKAFPIKGIDFVNYVCYRDFRNLSPKEYFYTQRDYCGWSNIVKFDAGGCECCKLPVKDYWSFHKE